MAQASGLQSLKNVNIKFLEEKKKEFQEKMELYIDRVQSEIQADDHLGERVMAQAITFLSQLMPDMSGCMQSEINKMYSELEQKQKKEQQKRKKLQDKAMTSKQKAPRSARLKTSFEARVSGDQNRSKVTNIVILPGGNILIADWNNNSLKYFNSQGYPLHKKKIGSGGCCLAEICDGRVALYNPLKNTLEIIRVTKSGIQEESRAEVKEEYGCLTALDQQTLACSESLRCKIDVFDLTGNCLRSITTSLRVNCLSPSEDGSLVCTFNTGILKINPVSGSEILKKSVPGVGLLAGVATTKDNCIIVGDMEKRDIHLLSSTGDLVQTLWSVPQADDSGELWYIAVSDDMMVCCTKRRIFVFELVY